VVSGVGARPVRRCGETPPSQSTPAGRLPPSQGQSVDTKEKALPPQLA
jgi:hypothetical protein